MSLRHPVLFLLLKLVGFFISTRPRKSGENDLYHSCTSFEGASRGRQPLNIFTRFIGAGGGWRRPTGCLKLQVIFRKEATNYRALLREMTCEDKASYGSSLPCSSSTGPTASLHSSALYSNNSEAVAKFIYFVAAAKASLAF